jgi:hypothetical protein
MFAQIVQQPDLQIAHWRAVGSLQRERGAELRLAARTAKKDDEGSRHEQRQFRPPVFFNQRQRQIDPGCNSGRGVNVPIANEDGVGIESDGGKTFGHLLTKMPVGRRSTTVQQSGGGKRERPSTDRPNSPRRLRCFPEPRQESRDVFDIYSAVTASYKQCVEDAADAAKISLRRNIHAAVAINQSIRFGRDQFDLVSRLLRIEIVLTELIRFGEDSQRPGDVQNLGARKGDDADPARAFV